MTQPPSGQPQRNPIRAALERFGRERRLPQPDSTAYHEHHYVYRNTAGLLICVCGEAQGQPQQEPALPLPEGWRGGKSCWCLWPAPSHDKNDDHCVRCGEASFQDEVLRPTQYGMMHSSCITNAKNSGEWAQERQAGGHHVHTRMLPGDRHYGHCVVLLEGGDLCGFEAPEQWWQGWEARGKADAANDRNWAERIEIAKAAREGGRILREGQE